MPKISEYNQFFDRFDGFAVCKICGKKLQTKGGNTSGLKKHYEGQHSQSNVPNVTTPLKRKANEPPALETPSKVPKCDKDLVQPTIINFVGKVATKVRARLSDKSLNAIIALRAFYQSESKTNTQ